MTVSDRTLLERNRLFRDIGLESVGHILKDRQVITLESGATLLAVGQENTPLYLLLDGEFRACLKGRDQPLCDVLLP